MRTTGALSIAHDGAVYLLKYRSTTGTVSLEAVNNGGVGTTFRGSETWTKSWTAFSPYGIGGQGHVLIYKVGTGSLRVLKLNADESGTTIVWSSAWTKGWS